MSEFAELVAIRSLLEQVPILVDRVGIGSAIVPGHETDDDPPMLRPPYAVILGDGELADIERATGSSEWDRQPSVIVHGYGESELAAVAVLDAVDAVLRPNGVGVTPAVPGRRTGRLRRIERPGNARDGNATPPVWAAIAVYQFTSQRTTL